MLRYGSDKPDLRPGMEIADLECASSPSRRSRVFRDAVAGGGVVRGFVVPGGGAVLAQGAGRSGGAGAAVRRERTRLGPRSAHGRAARVRRSRSSATSDAASGVRARPAATTGDLLLFVAGTAATVADVLGPLRLHVAKKREPARADDFQLRAGSPSSRCSSGTPDEKRWDSMHHPFTSPRPEDVPLLESAPGARARARLRPGAQRLGDRRRQHPNPSRRRAAAGVPAARHLGRGREGALRVLPRRARVRHAAARRHRLRPRSHRRAAVRRVVDSRSHRVPEDRAGRRPDGRRAVGGRRRSSCASCSIKHRIRPGH